MKEYSQLSINLSIFISPKKKTKSDMFKTLDVCECVLANAKASWSNKEFQTFEKEINDYSNKMKKYLESTDIAILKNGFPQKSKDLDYALNKALEYVELCEQKIGTRVEF